MMEYNDYTYFYAEGWLSDFNTDNIKEITIIKYPYIGKTEPIIANATQLGRINPLLSCETEKDVQDYMDYLENKYGGINEENISNKR